MAIQTEKQPSEIQVTFKNQAIKGFRDISYWNNILGNGASFTSGDERTICVNYTPQIEESLKTLCDEKNIPFSNGKTGPSISPRKGEALLIEIG